MKDLEKSFRYKSAEWLAGFCLLVSALFSCAGMPDGIPTAASQAQQPPASVSASQEQQPPSAPDPQPSPFWTGDGGSGNSIAILAPKAVNLTANQGYLPDLVQGEFVSNFSSFSAINVLDRQRFEEQYSELLSGWYADDAEENWDLGKLPPTTYIMNGSSLHKPRICKS